MPERGLEIDRQNCESRGTVRWRFRRAGDARWSTWMEGPKDDMERIMNEIKRRTP